MISRIFSKTSDNNLTHCERRKIIFDIIKKVMLTGVGLAAMTKDKVEEVARDLAKKGKPQGSVLSQI